MQPAQLLAPITGRFQEKIVSLALGSGSLAMEPHLSRWTEQLGEGLEARCCLELDVDYRVARLVMTLANTGRSPSAPIDPTAFRILLSDQGGLYRGFRASGGLADGHYPPDNYRSQEVLICGSLVNCSPPGGRSSDRNIPITMVADSSGDGLWFGLEWSGTWGHIIQTPKHGNATSVAADYGLSIVVKAGQGGFSLAAGEVLALPCVHVGFFDGGFDAGTNSLRRYLFDRICPRLDGKPMVSPASYDHWFGIGNNYDETFMRRQVDRVAELGLDYFVVDAAWHGGGFPHGVGNWDRVDQDKFPNGLKPLAEYVRSKGMKFGLWFEPERAHRGSSWPEAHPEFFITIGEDCHLNLVRRDAQDFLIEFMSGMIADLDIRWSRWDYNIDPVPFWNKADPTGRIQFDYIAGLYRVLDTLMERHPDWLIENCASGGRRLDIGSMKRAHTCWFSDEAVSPEICRYMQLNANCFLPAHLCNSAVVTFRDHGDGGLGAYDAISRMAGALSFDGDVASWSATLTNVMSTQVSLFKKIRHLLTGDYFHLLPAPVDSRDWEAGLFVSRNRSEALLFAFRVHGSATQRLILKGLDPGTYLMKELPPCASSRMIPGAELMGKGLELHLPERAGVMIHLAK
jgi:alpha-galactosidase